MPLPDRLLLLGSALLAVTLTACAPTLAPLYNDYEIQTEAGDVEQRITRALEAAGWAPTPADAPNAIATEERKLSNWVLYDVMVSLEAVPIGEDYVRLYVHPYRRYFTGSRSKIPFLKKGLRRAVLKELDPALEQQGLVAIGTSVSRDRKAAAR